MQFEFFAKKNRKHFKTIDPVFDYQIYSETILILEYEYKFERYSMNDFKRILINGKDLKEYEKEKSKKRKLHRNKIKR